MPAYVTALKMQGMFPAAKGRFVLLSDRLKCLMLEQRAGKLLLPMIKASGFLHSGLCSTNTTWSSGPWHIIFWEMGLSESEPMLIVELLLLLRSRGMWISIPRPGVELIPHLGGGVES